MNKKICICVQVLLYCMSINAISREEVPSSAESSGEPQENINPFYRNSIGLNVGYELGNKTGGLFDFGAIEGPNFGLEMDFSTTSNAGNEGGFTLFLGPRANLSFLFSSQLFSGSKSYSQIELGLAIKPLWSFRLANSFIAAYLNIVPGFSVRGSGGNGLNISLLPGVHYYFNDRIGIFGELGLHYNYTYTGKGLFGSSQFWSGVLNVGVSYVF